MCEGWPPKNSVVGIKAINPLDWVLVSSLFQGVFVILGQGDLSKPQVISHPSCNLCPGLPDLSLEEGGIFLHEADPW